MNYKVLYRKYRPTTFDEVIGQKNSIELLKSAIINDKISHAYIFSGPRGTGKTSTAKIFGKAINCSNPENGNPCGKCNNCLNYAENSDIYEIDAASNNGVDQIREIIDNVKLAPINSKYKVYIIDEVHMLSQSAFNALLLTLEEPPGHVVFIFATTDIEDVPITVLSRCQRIDFRKITSEDIVFNMRNIAKIEKINVDDDALEEIADYSEGGMRDALSILDQLSKKTDEITVDVVNENIGIMSKKNIIDLISNIEEENIENVVDFIEKARNESCDFKTLIKMLIREVKKKALLTLKGDEITRLNYKNYKDLCFELSGLLYKLNVNVDSFSLLELVLLNYIKIDSHQATIKQEISKTSAKEKTVDTEVQKEEKSEAKQAVETTETLVEKDDNYADELASVRVNNCFVSASKDYLNENKSSWKSFIKECDNKKLKGIIIDIEVVLSSDSYLVLKTDLEEKINLFNDELKKIEESYNKYTNKNYKLICIDEEKWQIEIEKYKKALSSGKKYELLKEPSKNCSEVITQNIFVEQKIEVK